ncbi:UNVERIFIED_CONTAM: hypothetical protein Sradi_3212900 [Sesamum radiatum]|uniref:Integrase catalytic domain-containing protein n=1 Tax=Sesamum radiatum TaxID=300843 RepID=A0AAW2RGB9_SESRA
MEELLDELHGAKYFSKLDLSWDDDHLVKLRHTLELLLRNQLLFKMSKCQFGKRQVEYLGHVITEDGVAADLLKKGLPTSTGKDTILVVVNKLSKYAHFLTLKHPFLAVVVAQLFTKNIFKLHWMPKLIISDRDPVFMSIFWREYFQLQEIKLKSSTAYHPQINGQIEVVNKCFQGCLCYMTGDQLKEWAYWLPLAELWETTVRILKEHFHNAQQRMKVEEDKKRNEREFAVGDLVSVISHSIHKLTPKFFEPFKVLQRVGVVDYKLELTEGTRIRYVFMFHNLKRK